MTVLEFDPTARDMPSVAVVQAVASELQRQHSDLECQLQDVIDLKALNRLFAPTADGRRRTHGAGMIQFEFCGCDVSIYSDGHLDAVLTGTGPLP